MQQSLEALEICSDHHHGGPEAYLMEHEADALPAHSVHGTSRILRGHGNILIGLLCCSPYFLRLCQAAKHL